MKRKSWLARAFLSIIYFYRQYISPITPATCRFYPTCSKYAAEAVNVHGARKGGWLALCRIARCHPWNSGGIDPVPPKE